MRTDFGRFLEDAILKHYNEAASRILSGQYATLELYQNKVGYLKGLEETIEIIRDAEDKLFGKEDENGRR